jgi:concanavalin A-like lectin/glucanase superfamily protein
VATKATTGAIKVSTGALRIGGDTSWSNEWFAGLIDEVRVYNRALTAAEITTDMNTAIG